MSKAKTINDLISKDVVNNPEHYNQGKIECIDSIEAMLTKEEFIGYLRGNSHKYRWRFRYKNGIPNIKKVTATCKVNALLIKKGI